MNRHASNFLWSMLVYALILAVICVAAWLSASTKQEPPNDAGFIKSHVEAPRSGKWPKVEKDFLEIHPVCAVCGKKGNKDNPLNVHHRLPFHKHPELELDPRNLITLCRTHHLLFGHLDEWASWNVDVEMDAEMWRKKLEERP